MILNKLDIKILFIFSYILMLPGLSASGQELNPREDIQNEGNFKKYFYQSLDYFKPLQDVDRDEFKKMRRRSTDVLEDILIGGSRSFAWVIPWIACMPRIFRENNTVTQLEDTLVLLTLVHSGIAMASDGLYDIEKVRAQKGIYALGASRDIQRIFFLTASLALLRQFVYPCIFDRSSMILNPFEVAIALFISIKILDATDRLQWSQEAHRDDFEEELEDYQD